MIKFTTKITLATVAVKVSDGYSSFQTFYTNGCVKKRAFQKLLNNSNHNDAIKYTCLEVYTNKYECEAELNETITSAIEKTLANNDIDCSCFLESEEPKEGDESEENGN